MSSERHPRLLIAVPRAGLWSESFIAAHLKGLKERTLVLTEGVLPKRVHEGPWIARMSAMGRVLDHVEARMRGTDQDGLLRRRIEGLIRRHGIEVVLAEYGTCGQAMADACERTGVPLIAHFHGFDAHTEEVLREMGNYALLFSKAARLVVVSRHMEQRLLELGAPREKVVYNCYGVDTQEFAGAVPNTAPRHFIAVGRFVEKKAPHVTLSAFEEVARQVPDARLTMIGDGPLRESCLQRVRHGVLAGRVALPGILGPKEVAQQMKHARVFVQHSVRALSGDSEGTPLAVLEAMASALPVIATRHAGILDVVAHEGEGLLCDEFDLADMTAHMLRLAKDPEQAARLGRSGREKAVRTFQVEDSIARLQTMLDGVAAKAQR